MQTFKTSDIYLAATLHTFDFRLHAIVWGDGKQAVFYFIDTPKLQSCAQAFYRDELQCNPRAVLSGLKKVKARLYEDRL